MKKLLAVAVALGALAVLAGKAQAAATADLTITVTPFYTKSIAITSGSPYAFGDLAVNTSSVSATAVVVQNDGAGPMTVGFQVTTEGSPWTVGAAAGDDAYNLRAMFNTTRPADGDFAAGDSLTTAVQQCDGTNFAGDRTGQNVPPAGANQNQNLWLRLAMPTTSSVATERTIVVQLSAN